MLFAIKIFNIFKSLIQNVSIRGEDRRERCMSAEGSSVKGSSQQSSTSFPKVKGRSPLFSGQGPLITGGLVNDTTPALVPDHTGTPSRDLLPSRRWPSTERNSYFECEM